LSIAKADPVVMELHLPSPNQSIESRALGCLAGLAVGNVLGLATESCTRERACALLGSTGPLLCLPLEERQRVWDDDLAMAMALAGCLADLPSDATHLDTSKVLEAYLGWLRSGARGIGGLTREVLTKTLAGEARASERVWGSRCERGARPLGNGAAMRTAPLGVAFAGRPELIARLAAEDAALTHWDPACRQTAAAVALLVAALIRREEDPLRFAHHHLGVLADGVAEALVPLPLEHLEERRIDGWDMGSTLLALQVAVSVLASGRSFPEGLLWTLRQGGDTDTNGAIVGALLGARDGLAAIPMEWRSCVPDGDRILTLAWSLWRRAAMPVDEVVR
jgi:ADP-ribosylglycohydrolase